MRAPKAARQHDEATNALGKMQAIRQAARPKRSK